MKIVPPPAVLTSPPAVATQSRCDALVPVAREKRTAPPLPLADAIEDVCAAVEHVWCVARDGEEEFSRDQRLCLLEAFHRLLDIDRELDLRGAAAEQER